MAVLIEVKAFRKNLMTWLNGISSLTAKVGGRICFGTPSVEPALPCITMSLARRPSGDFPAHAWDTRLILNIHGKNADELDEVEDIIHTDMRDRDVAKLALSGGGVRCFSFGIGEIPDDDEIFDPNNGSLISMDRRLIILASIVISPT